MLAQGSNPISIENALTGDTDWDVFGAGDSTIQGFATNISINKGETVDFKINTPSTNYRIDIYRLGYYNGAGARKVATVNPSATLPQTQPACASDSATGLFDCGNWAISASWTSTNAVTGVHVAKLVRIDTGGSSHIVFIVRDDARQADIIVQTSDTTWQAYNKYGGASLYCAPTGIGVSNAGSAYTCSNRATKVSYNRPFDTRVSSSPSWLFSAEYPMIRFLEANGYNVKYWAGVDTDRRGADLVNATIKPKAFFSVGHDEYWSGDQRTRVENARLAGIHLAFFSGNEVYWKTRYESNYRTLVTYKETLAGVKLDPETAIWTGAWRDPRFSPPADGGRPENGLTGSLWTVNSGTTAITVPAAFKNLRLWRNTRVADLTSGVATLTADTLGYEWNEDLDNGARPAGLMHLSSTTATGVQKIIDYGTAVGTGTATHHLTLYRHSSGAIVFGAGTVQWTWGLDATHDGGAPPAHIPDQAMQQAMVNLMADMGAQPATLQIGADPARPLTAATASADVTPPTSAITAPVASAQVPSGDPVTIQGTATDSGGGVPASVEVSIDGGATWQVAQGTSSWTFTGHFGVLGAATIKSRAIDDSGNMEAPSAGVNVTVIAGTCPCTTLFTAATVPANPSASDNAALELGVRFKSDVGGFITGIRFYKGANNTGTHVGNLWALNGSLLASVTFTNETATGWQQQLFTTPVPIAPNTVYVASYHAPVGGYASDGQYFATAGVDRAPLHAPSALNISGQGVFRYGSTNFPVNTFNATNYYVDVLFAEVTADSTGPIISQIRATAIDGSNAYITWKTNEAANSKLEYSLNQAFPPAETLTIFNGAFVTDHSISLTNLAPNATYFFRITSVDPSNNGTVALAPSFTTPGPTLRDTAVIDFSGGTPGANTYIAQTSNGEVILKPARGAEMFGTSLPAGWAGVNWQSGGSFVVGSGILSVDGARVGSCDTSLPDCEVGTFGPPASLEFVATFTGDPFQNAGLGVTFNDVPWAMFTTRSGGALHARTNATGGGEESMNLGTTYLGMPHRYRIDWTTTGFTYSVDGTVVATHTLSFVTPMRAVAASDFNPLGGNIVVDWIRQAPYSLAGSFVSRVFDALAPVNWRTAIWTSNAPAGTSVRIFLSTGDTPVPDGTWQTAEVTAQGAIDRTSRYIQYRADLTTTDAMKTPELSDILITTSQAPVAVNDSAVTQISTSKVFPASGPTSLKFNDTDADTTQAQLRVYSVTQPAHGTATLNGNLTVTYTPTTGYIGNDSFTYTITDGLLISNSATVSMVVGGQPTANPENATVAEDSGATVLNVLANDSHSDSGQTLTITSVTQGAHGTVTHTATTVSYAPAANYNGPDSFTYTISDTNNVTATTTVNMTVTSVNDNPSATNDPATVNEDSGANVIDVLANDSIAPDTGETLSVTGVTQGTNGTVTFSATNVTYTPAANYFGSDSFVYTISDGNGGTAAATVNVTIQSVNDAPTFTAGGNQSVPKHSGAQSVAWATNISAGPANESGQAVAFAVTNNTNPGLFSVAPAINASGTLTYTPSGTVGAATITITLGDDGGTANGGVNTSAPHNFTITVFDPPPVALCQNVTVTATLVGTAAASINNGSNDPDGGAVTLAQVPPGPYMPGQTSVQLNVTDSASQVTSCSATVTVNPYSIGASFGFEEASGTTVVDSSGNLNHGSIPASGGPQRVAGGRFGQGMQFDGVDDLVTVADSNSLDLTNAMTMMAWVKATTQTGWRNVILKQNGSDHAWAMYSNNQPSSLGQPSGYIFSGASVKSAAANEGAASGVWVHIAVTYDGASLKMYYNGALHRTVAATGNLPVTTGPVWLGGNQVWLDEFFSGVLDEVRIMGTALSVTDIRTLMVTPVVPGSAAPATDSTGLVASYNFNDGTANDRTGTNHGTLNGPVAAAGMYGQALSFDGTNDIVTIPDAAVLDLTNGMTLEAWIKPTTVSGWRTVLLKEGGPTGLVYGVYSSDQNQKPAGFSHIGSQDYDARGTEALATSAWSHVALTYNNGTLRIYVDGVPRGSRSVTGNITVSTGLLTVGGSTVWGEYFNGLIDNVRIYNRPLNIVEIQTNQVTPVN